ncbi:MAG: arginine repressor [Myxococcota bacterium]
MSTWQRKLAQIIMLEDFSTQSGLVQSLEDSGFRVNQGTVSRELKRIGVRKVGGIYRLGARMKHGVPIHSISVTSNGMLAVLKTQPAFASVLAHRIDASMVPGVLGTIAGDDTVFAALIDHSVYQLLCDFLGYAEPG